MEEDKIYTQDDISDDFDISDDSMDKNEQKKEDIDDSEIKELELKIEELDNKVSGNRFPRSETKTDFASGVINTIETKKIANLNDIETYDLIEKRKFYNFLKYFGWDGLSSRVIDNIRDVEDYSLSRDGKLLDNVFIEKKKNEGRTINEERRAKR